MGIHTLCLDPHPVLRQKARRIDALSNDIRRLARDMIDTMYANDGIGLAAPQIGESVQLFVANPSQRRGQELIVINPVVEVTRGRAAVTEGCLSLPHIWERVTRASHIRLTGQDLWGKPLTLQTDGLLAIVLQHEVDHLQGRLFIDRVSLVRRCRIAAYRTFAPAKLLRNLPVINFAERNVCRWFFLGPRHSPSRVSKRSWLAGTPSCCA